MEYANMKNTTITRKIGDQYVNFELTDAEMESAFSEFQFQNDVVNVKARLEESGEYEDFENIPDDVIYAMAKKYREHIEGFAETMGDNSIPSFEATVRDFADRLEEYKEKLKVFEYELQRTTTYTIRIAAKSEERADAWMERTFGNDEGRFDDELDNGYSDYDYGCGYECGTKPEYADYNAEEE